VIPLLGPGDPRPFPDVTRALRHPNGLLAAGADLSPGRLLAAYRRGIFPWYGPEDPILWWSPDPRTVLFPGQLHLSRSLRKRLRRRSFGVTTDRDFASVIRGCAAPRESTDMDRGETGTWLMPEMIAAYEELHHLGYAHSVEVWANGRLAGGLYGVAIGRVFFGESMFSRAPDASKVALVELCLILAARGFTLIDCQMYTPHLASLGAIEMPRTEFTAWLARSCEPTGGPASWDDGEVHYPLADLQDTANDRQQTPHECRR
jgi:leucyl/phenylalanyl-tRNA---protein transferase